MRHVLMAAALAAGVTGCATMQPVQRPPFPVAEYESLADEGTGVVTGQVFLRTMVGEVRYGAGSEVFLNPVTSYSTFWYQQDYMAGGRRLTPSDTRQDAYIIETQADGEGRFRFEHVPPGDYYLVSSVFWQVPVGYASSTQGGYIAERIKVENGKEVKQMLTR